MSDLKFCKDCKHYPKGIREWLNKWFKSNHIPECTKSPETHKNKITGKTIPITTSCYWERGQQLDRCCGKEAKYFEPLKTNKIEASKPYLARKNETKYKLPELGTKDRSKLVLDMGISRRHDLLMLDTLEQDKILEECKGWLYNIEKNLPYCEDEKS